METVRIAILDAYDNVLTFMDNDAPKALHYYDDELHEYLKGTANTFSFKASAKHEDSQSLVEGNKIAFVYRDRDYYLNIMNVRRDELEVEVMAYSLSFELLNEEKEKYAASKAMSFAEYLAALDYEKVLTLGINEVSDKSIKHEWTGTGTLLARIFSLATVFSAEVEFVPELNDDYSLKRIVLNVYKEHTDTVQGVGTDRADIVLRYGINVTGVTKTSDITELCTAIRPFGKDGLTIKSLDKTEYDADGNVEYKSPKDNRNILAVQARDRFPSNLLSNANDRYIAKVWEYDTDNVNVLYGQALAELKKLCVPQVTYEVEGHFDTAIGDTVTIADEEFTPELYLQARVTEQIVSFTNQSRNKTTFSNFKELQSEIDPSLIQKMNDLIAENKVYSCAISTDNGIVFKNGIGTTTLTANVRDSGTDVADDFTITWSKDGVELATGKTIAINASDINEKSVYRFDAKDALEKVRGSYEVTVSNVTDGKSGSIISNTEPEDKDNLWCDTSVTPPVIRQHNGEDWVLVNDQEDSIQRIYSNVYESMTENTNNILSQVNEKVYEKDEVDRLIVESDTKLDQAKGNIESQLNQLFSDIVNISESADGKFEEVHKYIRNVDGAIVIGIDGNPLTLKMQNDRISFMENEVEVAYISNQKMYISDAEVTNSHTIGTFAFAPRANGNLSFRKVK